jgi:glycerophosphoryl diester phosphodiesterase
MLAPRVTSAVAALLFAAAAGCGGGATGDPDAGPVLDPARFDCTAPGVPDRASPIPIACALDVTCRTPQIAAHRGAGGLLGVLAPEDTLSAYRAGIALGVEYVETDPRPTADGVLVNLHDPDVDRTTDGHGDVAEMTLAVVQALAIDAGELAGDFSCERIPTLVEVLETCRGRVVVLVDANKTDRVDLLVDAIHQADAVDWAIFDTSSIDKIDQALALDPDLHIHIRPDGLDQIGEQLDHFAPRLPVIVELEAADREAGSALVHQRGTRSLSDVFVEDALAAAQHDLSGYAAVFDEGVDIVQTDRPDLVQELLRARGLR